MCGLSGISSAYAPFSSAYTSSSLAYLPSSSAYMPSFLAFVFSLSAYTPSSSAYAPSSWFYCPGDRGLVVVVNKSPDTDVEHGGDRGVVYRGWDGSPMTDFSLLLLSGPQLCFSD